MMQLGDIRDSVVFQEVREEGRQEGRHEGRQEGQVETVAAFVRRLASKGKTVLEICEILELAEDRVKEILAPKKTDQN